MTFIALMGLTCKLINPAILIWTIYCRLYLCKRVTDIGKEYFILYIQYGQKQMCNFKITVTVVLKQCRISPYCLHWWIKQCYYGTFTGESEFFVFSTHWYQCLSSEGKIHKNMPIRRFYVLLYKLFKLFKNALAKMQS